MRRDVLSGLNCEHTINDSAIHNSRRQLILERVSRPYCSAESGRLTDPRSGWPPDPPRVEKRRKQFDAVDHSRARAAVVRISVEDVHIAVPHCAEPPPLRSADKHPCLGDSTRDIEAARQKEEELGIRRHKVVP